MVEGPGCKLNGEKIKQKLLNQTVNNLNGTRVSKDMKKKNGELPSFYRLISCKLQDVLVLGKELFLLFGDLCLRSATSCVSRYEKLKDVDICSPTFSQKKALALIKEHEDKQICDILLDQQILPGVGNIIKNEALFDSGLRPSSLVKELNDTYLSHLVKMTRDFTMIFYKCRKTGQNLGKHLKIYNKSVCGQCNGKVTVTRMGDDNDRMTYFCNNCQCNNPTLTQRTLPSKNSLLGWIHSEKPGGEQCNNDSQWACSACTLLNSSSHTQCSVCFTPKPKENIERSTPGFKNINSTAGILSPSFANSKRKLSDNAEESPFKKVKSDSREVINEDLKKNDCKIPFCPGHAKKCAMVEVRKKGDNYLRWFFACALRPRTKQCKFFKWADESFPICNGHGKKCSFRTVLKQGPNNGRKFFACSLDKSKQCGYFQWAEGYDAT